MKITENKSLLNFADLFEHEGKRLYIVGGFVRDRLLGKCEENCTDIDLASSAKIEDLVEFSKDSGAIVTPLSKDLGVAKIYLDGKSYEHATFRSEITRFNGQHYPEGVVFVENIKEDSARRDFTINAIYYDINHERLVDFYNGQEDIKNKIIRIIGNPETRIKEDSERILRALRLTFCLGFKIEDNLDLAIKTNANLLSSLKTARKSRELYKMLEDMQPNVKLFSVLMEYNCLQYLFPQIYGKILNNKKLIKVLDNISAVKKELRLAFLIDFCKTHAIEDEGVIGLMDYYILNFKETENCKNMQKILKNIAFFAKKRIKSIDFKCYLSDNSVSFTDAIEICQEIEKFYNIKRKAEIKKLNKMLLGK